MNTISELKEALRSLSAMELEGIADWLEWEVEASRYRTFHVREAQPAYRSEEEPVLMTWEEYLAFEEQSPYRHEYVNGVVYANSEDGFLYAINQGGTLKQRIFQQLNLGAAYTPASLGSDGKIYSQNAGHLFVVGN